MGNELEGNRPVNQSLTDRQKQILERVFSDRDAAAWISSIQSQTLSFDQIEEASYALSVEFGMNGIDESWEATDYGKEVETLLDIVNHPRLVR